MLKEDFLKFAEQGNSRVSINKSFENFKKNPLDVYKKLNNKNSFLFESGSSKGKWSRYSIIGTESNEIIKVNGNEVTHIENNEVNKYDVKDPLNWIENFYDETKIGNLPKDMPFSGGLVGYFGYETIKFIENKLNNKEKKDTLKVPDIFLFVCNEIIVFDNLKSSIHIILNTKTNNENNYDASLKRINLLEKIIFEDDKNNNYQNGPSKNDKFKSSFKKENFIKAVNQTKKYIADGDVMQVVLSQRLTKEFNGNPVNMYSALRDMNPSPYMYFLDMDDFQIIGSSPEILVKLEDKKVTVRPIAGTRPRGSNAVSYTHLTLPTKA